MTGSSAQYALYWSEGTASLLPQMVMEEVGIAYRIVPVDIAAGENRKPDFLAKNPDGTVPVLELPDGRFISETAAICLYLMEVHEANDLAIPVGDPLRGAFLQWLLYHANSLQPSYKHYYYPERYAPDPGRIEGTRDKAIELILDAWGPVERHLAAGGPYHFGERFSMLDLYLAMLVTWFPDESKLLEQMPAVRRCYSLVVERPAVVKCMGLQSQISVGQI